MKKPVNILVILTCVFVAFLGGFHIGRRMNRSPVHIYQITPSAESQPEALEEAQDEDEAVTEETEPGVVFPLNINTATIPELDELPGIGPVLAQRIVDYRTTCGGYKAVEELLKVNGIGDAKLMEIIDLITVETGG